MEGVLLDRLALIAEEFHNIEKGREEDKERGSGVAVRIYGSKAEQLVA